MRKKSKMILIHFFTFQWFMKIWHTLRLEKFGYIRVRVHTCMYLCMYMCGYNFLSIFSGAKINR